MPTTLRSLMNDQRMSLRPAIGVDDAVLDASIDSAHSSDLADPTPWLPSGCLLLTDGMQFADTAPGFADDYIARLRTHGVLALGFATRILHAEIPSEVARACASRGLPLFEIADRTPFMAIIRAVSDAVAADERSRLERSLAAQRSVARAALRPDGLGAILQELERELQCWVALFDAGGTRVHVTTTQRPIPDALTDAVESGVAEILARGRTAAMRLSTARHEDVSLQTLGLPPSLRGVLAVGTGTGAAHPASADLVDAVIALTSIALEQSSALSDARRRLRSGALEMLLSGAYDVADRSITQLCGPLPHDGFTLFCARAAVPAATTTAAFMNALTASLELWNEQHRGSLFFAEQGDDVVIVAHEDAVADVMTLFERHHAVAGSADVDSWQGLAVGLSQARRALSRTTPRARLVAFEDLASRGLLGHLEQTRAHDIARRILLPIEGQDTLRTVLTVWLRNNCSWDPSAKELGMHRHTLRSRIDAIGSRLGMDLDDFAARAEVWTALQLTLPDAEAALSSAETRG